MNVLITGATGFIGGYTAEELCAQGHAVSALVRSEQKAAVLAKRGIRPVAGDITDRESLGRIQGAFDAVVHCAAYVEDKNEELLYRVNVEGTENICRLAERIGARRLVYASSVAVVSGNAQSPLTEELPYAATNLYGSSKIEAEKAVAAARLRGLPSAIIRPCMVYGEGEPHLFGLLMRLLQMRMLPLVDGGRNKMHLVYVKSVAAVMAAALIDDRFLEGSFFVADEDVLTVSEIFTALARAIGAPDPLALSCRLTPLLAGLPFLGRKLSFFLKDRVYDISRLRAAGFSPRYRTEPSLAKSAQWWLEQRKGQSGFLR